MNYQHTPEHHHEHGHGPLEYNLAFGLAVSLNFIFCLIEAGYAIMAHSMSLLADAGHNFGDVLGLLMAWGASWLLKKDSSAKYSYGFKKTTVFAALANAIILIVGSALIAYESILKLLHPVVVDEITVIVVALVGILINGSTAMLFMRDKEKDLNIKGAYLHLAWDAMIAFGVVIAGGIIFMTEWLWVDPIVSIVIVVVILFNTSGLLRDSINMMLDAVPHNINQEAVKIYLAKIKGVQSIHDLHIWGLSTQEIALTAHLIMPHSTLSDHDHEEINCALREKFNIKHVTLQVENGHLEDPCGQVEKC